MRLIGYYDSEFDNIKTKDGQGSGLDADTLDGLNSGQFLRSDAININSEFKLNKTDVFFSNDSKEIMSYDNVNDKLTIGTGFTSVMINNLDGFIINNITTILNDLKTIDGTGSGLDADLLDGQHGSYYLPAATYTSTDVLTKIKTVDGASSGLDADLLDGQHGSYYQQALGDISGLELTANLAGDRTSFVDFHSDTTNTDFSARIIRYGGVNGSLQIINAGNGNLELMNAGTGSLYYNSNLIYHAGLLTTLLTDLKTVDGTGSGLDADLLDGQHGSYYLPAATYTAADVLTKLKTVDGTGSGLDADLLDGQHGSYYQQPWRRFDALELSSDLTGDRYSFVDFHSDDTNTDYSARIIRNGGVNGDLEIKNNGTGTLYYNSNLIYHAGNVATLAEALNLGGYMPQEKIVTASDTVMVSALTEETYVTMILVTNTMKEFYVFHPGIYRIKVDVKCSHANYYKLHITKNDVDMYVSTALSTGYLTHISDIGCKAGDRLSIKLEQYYAPDTTLITGYCKNLYICGTLSNLSSTNVILITNS